MSPASGTLDERMEKIIEMLTRLASGDLEVRLPHPRGAADPLSLIATGLNMLAEELAVSIESEKNLRSTLEKQVEQRTADLEEKVAMVEAQSRTILELSTPVLKVWDGVLVLPLIGTVDTVRAQQITSNLLDSIAATQAAFIILDITGVPVIDTSVANHIIITVQAARMLGAQVFLTGVGPNNAQTLTKLGMNLTSILECKSTLHAGLQLALQLKERATANGRE
jgi:rsbT co-antagonist protein RsbR